MKKGKKISILMIVLLLITVYGYGNNKNIKSKIIKTKQLDFPIETTNDAPAVKNAVLKVAIVKDTPLVGILNEAFYSDGYDGTIMDNFLGSAIFETDENFEVTNTGIAEMHVDASKKKVTIKIKNDIKWSDGKPLTSDDIIYSYEVIGNKDYTGIRYSDASEKIVGMKDFHEGKSSNISGIKKINEKVVEISFTELGQGVYTIGNGLIGFALPKHYLIDVPIKDLEKSEKIRNKTVTLGAYTVTGGIQGKKLELTANSYYFKGKPKIYKVIVEVVNSEIIASELKRGEYDIALQIPAELYKSYKNFNNLEILGRQEMYYSYMGFKLGKYDKEKGINITDPNAKMSDIRLRQALAYGLNVDKMIKKYYEMRERATMAVPPIVKKYYTKDIEGFPYNPEKAKKLLDEAGYKDIDGDGYRENKNGEQFEVNVAVMSGGEISKELLNYYLEQWDKIGIYAVPSRDMLMGFYEFYDRIENDDPEIDVFFAAWGVGTDLDEMRAKGPRSQLNYTRFVSDENNRLMAEISSPRTLENSDYRVEAYKKWQKYYINQAVEVPLTYRYEIIPVNKRVKNYYIGYDANSKGRGVEQWELTAEEPIKASK